MDKMKKGDIVQVNPEKFPKLAWQYFEIDRIITRDIDQTLKIEVYELKAREIDHSKKAKKNKKKLDKILTRTVFQENDLMIMVPADERIT